MKPAEKSHIVWIPRILSLLFIAFIFLFSLDVWQQQDLTVWQKLIGFVIHNIPVILLAVVLAVSWHHPAAGAILYGVAGLFYFIMIVDDFELISFLILPVPLWVISLLFLFVWKSNRMTTER
ncbi:MAG: hypothetical protein PQJ47_11630 [Sphaerochaetaceae bacterium]|nr:hypothetical protein [Sphaerochaetaceae bacterium]